jgi:hypothetical protein
MGSGNWNTTVYTTRATSKAASGRSTFDYDDDFRAGRVSTINPLVDPKIVAGPASPHAGQVMREVMISDEHPNPTPIAVILDVTGSNIEAAKIAHSKMPQLHGLLQRKGYADDPQILFGAIGDAFSDRFPLQLGQFESDNRMDEQLEALILEGNGGGQRSETYELAAYFLARHTYLQSYEELGKKGYAFFIGDEMPYDMIRQNYGGHYDRGHTMTSMIGDTLQEDISTAAIFKELQERYEVFFLFQKQGTYHEDEILPAWRKLLGERAVVLEDPSAVCEFIAGLLGMLEGGIDHEEAIADLIAIGADPKAARAAGKALALVGAGTSKAVVGSGSLPTSGSDSGTTRI